MRAIISGVVALAAMTVFASAQSETITVTGGAPMPNGGVEVRKIAVNVGALDPSKPENAPAILALLKNAAVKVCKPSRTNDNGLNARIQTCEKRAIADTVYSLDLPELKHLADAN
jgi:UrcA family protein